MKFIDLFCGIGGFRLGLERAKGFDCVWANDNDKFACQSYRRRFGNQELHEGDIRAVDVNAIPDHDLLCGGFPCQSFSIAGQRKGFQDTRGALFFEICRIIRAKRPRYLFLENVKGLLSADNGAVFHTILKSLDDLGYDVQWQVLNSKDFGVPQNRERVFIIGHLRGTARPQVFPFGEADNVYPEADEGRQIARTLDANYYKGMCRQGRTAIATCLDANYGKGWLDHGQRTMIIQSGNRAKGKPGIYDGEIPAMAQDYGTGGGNVPMVANAVDPDGYLRMGTRPRDEQGRPQLLPIGYRRIRRLTPTECERLQGFPDDWTMGISDTQRYRGLGNAVTVNVIEAIGRRLSETLLSG